MKQEKFHKEGFKYNPFSLPRTFRKKSNSCSSYNQLFYKELIQQTEQAYHGHNGSGSS